MVKIKGGRNKFFIHIPYLVPRRKLTVKIYSVDHGSGDAKSSNFISERLLRVMQRMLSYTECLSVKFLYVVHEKKM